MLADFELTGLTDGRFDAVFGDARLHVLVLAQTAIRDLPAGIHIGIIALGYSCSSRWRAEC